MPRFSEQTYPRTILLSASYNRSHKEHQFENQARYSGLSYFRDTENGKLMVHAYVDKEGYQMLEYDPVQDSIKSIIHIVPSSFVAASFT